MREFGTQGGAILEAVSRVRAWVYGDPLLLILAIWFAVATGVRLFPPFRACASAVNRLPRSLWAIPLIAYVLVALWYGRIPTYFDHIEASVAAISWNMVLGYPLYPAGAEPFQYALPYGPALYGANALTLRLLGPGLAASKITALIAALASIVIVASALRTRIGPLSSAGVLSLAYLAFGPMSLWTRAEPLLLLAVACAVACIDLERRRAVFSIGVLLAAAASVKITGVLYFVPLVALLHVRYGTVATGGMLAVAAALTGAPFFVLPGASLPNYLQVLAWTGQHGVRWHSLSTTAQWAAVIVIPAFITRAARPAAARDDLGTARWALLLAGVAMVPLAAKHGGGPYHLLPFVPVALCLSASPSREGQPGTARFAHARIAFIVALLAIGLVHQAYWISSIRSRPVAATAREARDLLRANPHSTAIGYSSNYQLSVLRPLPVFEGTPYVLDAPALMDRQFSGVAFPAGALRLLESCAIDTWLLPAGGEPFDVPNAYDARLRVFPPAFTEMFRAHYRLVDRGTFFEVWRCRRKSDDVRSGREDG